MPDDAGQRVLQRRREPADQHLQQRVEADPAGRADRDDRVERAARDRRLQVVDQGGDLDVLALEVALHERLVLGLLDDPLDERGAGVFGAVGRLPRGGLREQAVEAGHRLAVADRQVERGDAGAEALLAGRDRGLQVGARVVAAGDDDRARHADRGALLPLRDGGRVDRAFAALVRGDDEQGGVGGAQAGAQLADEVPVAGGVDQVDLGVLVEDRGDGQRDRPLLAHRGGIVVADRGAVDDGARAGDRGGVGEQRLDQGRLPRSGGPDEDHVAHFGRIGDGHRRPFVSERLAALTVMGRPPPRHCVEASGSSHTRSRGGHNPPRAE